jgi:hypothetical protein
MRKLLFAVAAVGLALAIGGSVAEATDMTKKVGVGVRSHPLAWAIRFGASDKLAIEGQAGFYKPDEGDTEVALAGILDYALFGGEMYNLYFSPGVAFVSNPSDFSGVVDSRFGVTVGASAEVWVADAISLGMRSGVNLVSTSFSEEGADSATDIFTMADPVTAFQATFYFKP